MGGDHLSTPKKTANRLLSESDSKTDSSQSPLHFAHCVVIEAEDPSTPVTNKSPFVIEKQISSILGTPKSLKKLKNSTILVECFPKQQTTNHLKGILAHIMRHLRDKNLGTKNHNRGSTTFLKF